MRLFYRNNFSVAVALATMLCFQPDASIDQHNHLFAYAQQDVQDVFSEPEPASDLDKAQATRIIKPRQPRIKRNTSRERKPTPESKQVHMEDRQHQEGDNLATVPAGNPLITHRRFKAKSDETPLRSRDKTKAEHFNRNAKRHSYHQLYDFRETGGRDILVKDGLEVAVGQTVTLILADNPSAGFIWKVDSAKANSLWSTKEDFKDSKATSAVPGVR